MPKDVFISYSSKDREWAEQICHVLELNHISYWIAPECIPGGSNYTTEIPLAIQSCCVFFILLTDHSVQSPWVKKELDTAINEKKLILPLLLQGTEMPSDFVFLLNGVQFYSTGNQNDPTSEILDRIKKECAERKQDSTVMIEGEPKHICPKCGCDNINDDYKHIEKTSYEQLQDFYKNHWVYLMPFFTSIIIAVMLCIRDLSLSDYLKEIFICGAIMSILTSSLKIALIYYPIYQKRKNLQRGFVVKHVSCCRCGYRFKIKTSAENNTYMQ